MDDGLGCPGGHRFDVARQGYVSLLPGRGSKHRSDTAPMVAARRRVLDSALFAPLRSAVASAAADGADPGSVIVDAGCGTGQYLSSAVDALPQSRGLGVDLSVYCARAAARCHDRAAAVVADLWAGLPVADGVAQTVLSVFAPRNARAVRRILAPGGHWIVVTPHTDHLRLLREPLGMLDVADGKLGRLRAELTEHAFTEVSSTPVRSAATLGAAELADLAGMGPAGFHRTDAELAAAARTLAGRHSGRVPAELAVTVTVARRR